MPDEPSTTTSRESRAAWPTYATREHKPFRRALISATENVTGRRWLGRRYDRALDSSEEAGQFFGRVLQELEIRVDLPAAQLDRIPREGPVLMVANHPLGVVDGLILCDIAYRTRQTFRILLHVGLAREPRLEPYMLPVDMTGDAAAKDLNRDTVRRARTELEGGGTVLLFPAGGISTQRGLKHGVTDLPWHPMVARLFRESRVPVVPVHFGGRNSHLFQAVSQFSLTLRAAVLLREMRRLRGRTVMVRIGEPLQWTDEAYAGLDDRQLTEQIRQAVYAEAPAREARRRPW